MKTDLGSSGGTASALSEINVTPLVDVMLVLLIVFMISAPLMQQGMEINLPKANTGTLQENPDFLMVNVDAGGKISLGEKSLSRDALYKHLLAISSAKPETQVYVRADARVPYGSVAKVIAQVKKAKLHRVGLVTQPEDASE